ncbi:hypothetical protein NOF04DRAFT_1332886 [Fusarium oxysporum II5]|uniref:Allergen Fus c 3 n=4 Tax=Fusarium oxysporum species complex TaxID=171631 RepID=N1S9W0_FUSC4|nr:uncharacterized protein FOIG_08430 [Fusarium odoratissimum NRRL 54006]EMT71690.1 Allergen Fus c 3 [Fusarium odoratissimum]EXL99380.1 hypothetical protein FOIG_08430 [Fusarium odoratissimum NRRL 54006]KAK2125306.1 hypothetical protein NOF04DRAFT_1332886 [Fusarium oxysporum II5]TXC03100.1 hypothetical protein FocTR4_00015706 [Fusarium oxysporum f. sp. cubense]
MPAHLIAVDLGDISWDRRGSGLESPSAGHLLDPVMQGGEHLVQTEDLLLDDALWGIDGYHLALSTPNLLLSDSSSAGPLPLDPTMIRIGTCDSGLFTLSPSIPVRPESSESGWFSMDPDKGLSQEFGTKGPIATTVSLQTDSLEDVPKASSPAVKMRSASRKPKTLRGKPSIPANIELARESLNNVERDYRTRLKFRFEKLLRAVQESMLKSETKDEDGSVRDDYHFSRGEVLDAARQRILELEEEKRRLTTRVEILSHNLMVNRRRPTVAKV